MATTLRRDEGSPNRERATTGVAPSLAKRSLPAWRTRDEVPPSQQAKQILEAFAKRITALPISDESQSRLAADAASLASETRDGPTFWEHFLNFERSLMTVLRTESTEISQRPDVLYRLCDTELAEYATELSTLEKSEAAQKARRADTSDRRSQKFVTTLTKDFDRPLQSESAGGLFTSKFAELNAHFSATRESVPSASRPVIPLDPDSLKRVRRVIRQLEIFAKVVPDQYAIVFERTLSKHEERRRFIQKLTGHITRIVDRLSAFADPNHSPTSIATALEKVETRLRAILPDFPGRPFALIDRADPDRESEAPHRLLRNYEAQQDDLRLQLSLLSSAADELRQRIRDEENAWPDERDALEARADAELDEDAERRRVADLRDENRGHRESLPVDLERNFAELCEVKASLPRVQRELSASRSRLMRLHARARALTLESEMKADASSAAVAFRSCEETAVRLQVRGREAAQLKRLAAARKGAETVDDSTFATFREVAEKCRTIRDAIKSKTSELEDMRLQAVRSEFKAKYVEALDARLAEVRALLAGEYSTGAFLEERALLAKAVFRADLLRDIPREAASSHLEPEEGLGWEEEEDVQEGKVHSELAEKMAEIEDELDQELTSARAEEAALAAVVRSRGAPVRGTNAEMEEELRIEKKLANWIDRIETVLGRGRGREMDRRVDHIKAQIDLFDRLNTAQRIERLRGIAEGWNEEEEEVE